MAHSKSKSWTSLVAQRLKICLPMQGTWVWSLIQEDYTCGGGNQACELWLASLRALDPVLFNKRNRRNEKSARCN